MKEIFTGEVLSELDQLLIDFNQRETEVQNALLSQGASPDDLDRMYNRHFFELIGDVFGPRWAKQLQNYGTRKHR